jgi:hypothetical protein
MAGKNQIIEAKFIGQDPKAFHISLVSNRLVGMTDMGSTGASLSIHYLTLDDLLELQRAINDQIGYLANADKPIERT